MLKITIVIEVPDIKDPDSLDATNAIGIVEDELSPLSYQWYIDDVKLEDNE